MGGFSVPGQLLLGPGPIPGPECQVRRMTGKQGFQKSQPSKGNRPKRPIIMVPLDPGVGTWLPDLEMKGFIK